MRLGLRGCHFYRANALEKREEERERGYFRVSSPLKKHEPVPNANGPRPWQLDRPGCEPPLPAGVPAFPTFAPTCSISPFSNHLSHYAVARVCAPRSDPFANQDFGVADLWEATVKKFANRPSIIFEGQTFTFKQIDERTSRRAPCPLRSCWRAHIAHRARLLARPLASQRPTASYVGDPDPRPCAALANLTHPTALDPRNRPTSCSPRASSAAVSTANERR